jgi:hypothetical protein
MLQGEPLFERFAANGIPGEPPITPDQRRMTSPRPGVGVATSVEAAAQGHETDRLTVPEGHTRPNLANHFAVLGAPRAGL